MPKAPSQPRTAAHDRPIRPSRSLPAQREFAVSQTVEKVDIGSKADLPATDILASLPTPAAHPSKFSRQSARHDALLSKLSSAAAAAPHAPYTISRSALRRRKHKAREALPMQGLSAALEEVAADADREQMERQRERARAGMIGEGKEHGLSARERKKAIKTEGKHLGAVLTDPAFRANPFAAIRAHAANTLDKRETDLPSAQDDS